MALPILTQATQPRAGKPPGLFEARSQRERWWVAMGILRKMMPLLMAVNSIGHLEPQPQGQAGDKEDDKEMEDTSSASSRPAGPATAKPLLLADVAPTLSFIEVFAGDRAVTKAMKLFKYNGRSFDGRISMLHNFMSPVGYLALLKSILEVHRFGIVWLAPPCSTWVWISRHSCGRPPAPLRSWRCLARKFSITCPHLMRTFHFRGGSV